MCLSVALAVPVIPLDLPLLGRQVVGGKGFVCTALVGTELNGFKIIKHCHHSSTKSAFGFCCVLCGGCNKVFWN